jgi:hypothetical protein
MDNQISAIFLGASRMAIQAESAFQTIAVVIKDRARQEKAPDAFRDELLADVAALAAKFSQPWPKEGEASGPPSSLGTGESSPAKAEATANTAGCGSCK